MHCITIKFNNEPSVWTLLYKGEESAMLAWKILMAPAGLPAAMVADDFGQTAFVNFASIAGAMLEDLDKSMLAHIERGLHNARTQAKAQQIATNDPVLKTAAMTRGGPAMFSPQGNGGFPHS